MVKYRRNWLPGATYFFTLTLADHPHAIFTLPQGDADFAGRRRRIKGRFSSGLLAAGVDVKRHANGDLALLPADWAGNVSAGALPFGERRT